MKEFKSILAEFGKLADTRKAALATVVQVRGSSYRTPGARMLITDDGRWVGSISGGCLEGDALRKARQVMMDGQAKTVTYDTREESNQNLGISLGCNGLIDVLIEPLTLHDNLRTLEVFRKATAVNAPVALATIFGGPREFIGRKFLRTSQEVLFSNVEDTRITSALSGDLTALFHNSASRASQYKTADGAAVDVFTELIQPCISLIIFGGGFDARPVSSLAKTLAWEVTVTDECVAHIAPLFFPTADKLSLCQRSFIDRDFSITPYTACLLMSHNYEYDRDVLKKLLGTTTPFIGILGPRKRFDKMLDEFAEQGMILSDTDFHRVHAPVGLDIGAEAADEIAVSIIAEIQAKFANRTGSFLKHRNGPIHQRDLDSDQVLKQVYIR